MQHICGSRSIFVCVCVWAGGGDVGPPLAPPSQFLVQQVKKSKNPILWGWWWLVKHSIV